ncbi:MAG: tetratricopeptide repeat protein [Terriglobales bacterium]
MWKCFLVVAVLAAASCSVGQSAPTTDQGQSAGPQANQAPPRSEPNLAPRGPGDSSSRDTNPGPPPDAPDDSVSEFRAWDPHKAMKDVEIGDFYFKRENYRGALSRYCEALQYKPNDAIATFRIAEALEKLGDLAGARTYYETYLKILPGGQFAAQSKKALERIKQQAEQPNKHLAEQRGCEPPGKAAKSRPEPFDSDRPVLTRKPTSPPSGKSQ